MFTKWRQSGWRTVVSRGLAALKEWAGRLKRDGVAVYCAARNPQTPLGIRLLALAVAAYALSPIDLIPDFIPVLGYLDDLILIPLGLWLVIRLLPPAILEASRAQAGQLLKRPRSLMAAAFIACLWLVGGFVLILALVKWLR